MRESKQVEFKAQWNDEHLKTICAFANSEGGIIYIGVDDKGNPIGTTNIDKLLEDIPNKILSKLGVIADVDVEMLKGQEVIKIKVEKSEVPISYDGKFYIRTGSTIQQLSGNELVRFMLKKQRISWDSLPSEAGIDEVDIETIERFKRMAKKRLPEISDEDSIEKILKNLELIKEDKLTNAGLLLFGKKPQKYIHGAGARVGRFKTPTIILDTVDVSGNLFKQLDGLMEAIKKHLNVRFEIKGIEREDIWDYPLEAIREAVINALIHRDYLSLADIQIKIFDDKIWFYNPGKLPEEITIEMLKQDHASIPRNRHIAYVFFLAGLIEKWGSGTKRMVELCKEAGLPEPEFKEEGGFVVEFYKDIYTEEYLAKLGLNERQIRAVMYVKEKGRITNKEYQEICSVSKATATRDLTELVNMGIFSICGVGKRTLHYILMNQK
ncbi:putative transcriptional regulator [Caldicellulosiruptor acetigenus I77R1B]|uniref:Putative transcriptional regulator n=1 Tax=Caldicellulosiruptor acetigenus (strain ATCC 700853 / DSM 12137 / I77R1B) TaxID=632335 RepID=E4SA96_CALA7|nr:helix-turn-helix domain-containing protein [Caldicellulosiruptor acetigenus]ADQ40173.1 putative transcriptional regulator [Caldicellulosiruptor acetigenus I77R1B]